ncbi:MAG: dihydroorotase [Candidatus Fimenecus sp.]|nr:dihydroorotase [Ruminococcus sp.]MDY4908653.1 dihydroorotase [Candidatus Fimenecus sp.]MDY6060191.1 dihydroorotase [Candidatus Fimenecus sp.]
MNNIINAQICTLTSFPQFTKETVLGAFSEFGASVYNSSQYMIFPGFCDVHVHLRQPGFSYKETIKSGTQASAHGGYTTVFSMPNLKPVPDSAEHLKEQLDIIKKDAVINVLPYGAITVGQNGEELSDMEGMAKDVIAFSDDGRGVQSEEMMKEAMLRAKALGKIIVAHCEDNSLLHGGYIHDGVYASKHSHRGICSESEWKPIKRDLELCRQTGCAYHVCHISCKESVELIRQAKAQGIDVTCETGPHYLILTDEDLKEDGRFKMNPPLRSKEDRQALIEGVLDGTIDMIATDHAPHSQEEKSRGLEKSAFGIVGIETAFQLLYTHLVKKNIISLERLVELLAVNPRKRFGLEYDNSFTVWDLDKKTVINPSDFLSMGKATPFEGEEVFGECELTVCNGKTAYKKF